TEYSALVGARERVTQWQGEVDRITARIADIDSNIESLQELVAGAFDPDTKAVLQGEVDAAIAERDRIMPGLQSDLATARGKRDQAQTARAAAEAAFAPVQRSIDTLDAQRKSQRNAVESSEALAKTAFDTAVDTLRRYEQATTAFAHVSVPVWGSEVQ